MSVHYIDCIRCGSFIPPSERFRRLDDMCVLCVITLEQQDAEVSP